MRNPDIIVKNRRLTPMHDSSYSIIGEAMDKIPYLKPMQEFLTQEAKGPKRNAAQSRKPN